MDISTLTKGLKKVLAEQTDTTAPSKPSDKYNLPLQVAAVRGMNPAQAKDFKKRVDNLIPELNLPSNNPIWNLLIQPTINAVPEAGKSLAKLPADRSLLETGGDALKVASGAVVGANLLHAGVAGANAVANSPLVNNEEGGANFAQSTTPGSPVNTNPSGAVNSTNAQPTLEQLTEKAGGWQPGLRAKFDAALLTKNGADIRALLPQVPVEYATRFASEIAQALGR